MFEVNEEANWSWIEGRNRTRRDARVSPAIWGVTSFWLVLCCAAVTFAKCKSADRLPTLSFFLSFFLPQSVFIPFVKHMYSFVHSSFVHAFMHLSIYLHICFHAFFSIFKSREYFVYLWILKQQLHLQCINTRLCIGQLFVIVYLNICLKTNQFHFPCSFWHTF